MNAHRPRKPRKDGAALRYLDDWRHHVERTERQARDRSFEGWGCPCCVGDEVGNRDRLEGLMHNGGRRAHKLRVAVTELDERFRFVTVERDAWQSMSWWGRREPW